MNQLTKELVKYILEVDDFSESVCGNCGYKGHNATHICEESNPDPNINNNNIKGWGFKEYMKSFLEYCIGKEMNIHPLPKLKIINNDVENAEKILGMTGYYNPNSKIITLFTLNRHPKDVLRTFAHELVHHEQNLENKLNHGNSTNTTIDPKLSIIEDEAYLKGSRIFRHWEDQLKEKK